MTRAEAIVLKIGDKILYSDNVEIVTRIKVTDRDIIVNGKSHSKIRRVKDGLSKTKRYIQNERLKEE